MCASLLCPHPTRVILFIASCSQPQDSPPTVGCLSPSPICLQLERILNLQPNQPGDIETTAISSTCLS